MRRTGRYGTVHVPLSSGVQITDDELTKVASKEIMGEIYADRFYGKTGALFNGEKPLVIRPQGIVGAASITPASGNDKVASSAFGFFKDTGAKSTAAATASITITRAASLKTAWNLIVVNTGTGVVSAVKGTDGDALVETFGDAAGQIPLAQDDELVLGAVKAPNGAAAVTQADILYRLTDGTLLQERSDSPKYDILHAMGGILFRGELLACHDDGTGAAIPRKVFVSYYDLQDVMVELGHTTKWNLNGSNPTTKQAAQNDLVAPAAISGPPEWSGSFERYSVDLALFKLAMHAKFAIVKLYQDKSDAGYFYGPVLVKDWGQNCEQSANMMDTLGFEGAGPLEAVE